MFLFRNFYCFWCFFSYITNTALPTYSKYASIMHSLGIEGRICLENKKERRPLDVVRAEPFDYERIHARLEAMRSASKAYLQTPLDDAAALLAEQSHFSDARHLTRIPFLHIMFDVQQLDGEQIGGTSTHE